MWYGLLFILIGLPSYFFIIGFKNNSKRILYLILGCILSIPGLLLASNEIGYRVLQKDLTTASIQLFEKNYGIPKEEIIVIEPMASYAKHNMTMQITTKKDFANWKTKISQNNQLLSGEKLTSEELEKTANDVKQCEITYSSNFYIKGQGDYMYPYSKFKYHKNEDRIGTNVSVDKNNLPDVIRLSRSQSETKKRLHEFYVYPPSDKEIEAILEHAIDPYNNYELDN